MTHIYRESKLGWFNHVSYYIQVAGVLDLQEVYEHDRSFHVNMESSSQSDTFFLTLIITTSLKCPSQSISEILTSLAGLAEGLSRHLEGIRNPPGHTVATTAETLIE